MAEEILVETERIVGTSCFYGEIWKTMLRSPKCRLEAIKYLHKKIPKSPKDSGVYHPSRSLLVTEGKISLGERNQEEDNKYVYHYYPKKDSLIMEALQVGMSRESGNLINRAVLDFLISHMPIR